MNKPKNQRATTRVANRINQRGDEDLHSDGMVNRDRPRDTRPDYCYNQHTGRANSGELQNYGRPAANLMGNMGRDLNEGAKRPPVSRVPDFERHLGSSDSLNFGSQERNPGGVRAYEVRGQDNFQGDSDSINMGRGPTRGNAQGPKNVKTIRNR